MAVGVDGRRHLVVDEWRSSVRVEIGEVPDLPATHSVDDIVESRLRFEETIAAIRRLSSSDQQYLIDLTREPAEAGPLPSRVKVRVHRARRRLLVALGEIGALVAGCSSSGWGITTCVT